MLPLPSAASLNNTTACRQIFELTAGVKMDSIRVRLFVFGILLRYLDMPCYICIVFVLFFSFAV